VRRHINYLTVFAGNMNGTNASRGMLSLKKTRVKRKERSSALKKELEVCHHGLTPPGISNLASNCYINSILQCLFNHPTFLGLLNTRCSKNYLSGVSGEIRIVILLIRDIPQGYRSIWLMFLLP